MKSDRAKRGFPLEFIPAVGMVPIIRRTIKMGTPSSTELSTSKYATEVDALMGYSVCQAAMAGLSCAGLYLFLS